jgi:NADPH:quinone reductase-like Zn-dependent oxidoreductase
MTQTDPKTRRADQFQGDYEAFQVGRGDTMQAIVNTKYGSPDVLQLIEVERPTPQDNEVLVKVHAASVNAAELHLLRGKPFLMRFMGYGFLKPKHTILGAAFAGRVEAVGRNVAQFQPGKENTHDTNENTYHLTQTHE